MSADLIVQFFFPIFFINDPNMFLSLFSEVDIYSQFLRCSPFRLKWWWCREKKDGSRQKMICHVWRCDVFLAVVLSRITGTKYPFCPFVWRTKWQCFQRSATKQIFTEGLRWIFKRLPNLGISYSSAVMLLDSYAIISLQRHIYPFAVIKLFITAQIIYFRSCLSKKLPH